ncbi:hypothetical protein HBI34_040030 [Parastagonospora nodorum]|nr:hypothetical protein HBI34_040030 [Parastagonospora nodorum]
MATMQPVTGSPLLPLPSCLARATASSGSNRQARRSRAPIADTQTREGTESHRNECAKGPVGLRLQWLGQEQLASASLGRARPRTARGLLSKAGAARPMPFAAHSSQLHHYQASRRHVYHIDPGSVQSGSFWHQLVSERLQHQMCSRQTRTFLLSPSAATLPLSHARTLRARRTLATMYAPQFSQPPPPGYGMPGDFHHRTTPPMSPGPGANYYSPRHAPQFASPSPRTSPKVQGYGHSRRASHAVPPQYSHSASRGVYDSGIPTSRAYATPRATPGPTPEYVPIYDEPKTASRPRRASGTGRTQPATPKKPAATKPTNKATEEDARRAGIPAGYSYKNWDPSEEPIMLLGSVFDANSLGKWIYDWTVFYNGPATPLAEMAGELWLLLIQLAGKVKRAEETMPKIRKKESHEMVEDFLESGERLWIRFAKLLKVCEDYMWKAAKKENGEKKPVSMGKNSGREFVDSIFGRDRELDKTEKLMTGMRLWSMRFDANCDDILSHPTA